MRTIAAALIALALCAPMSAAQTTTPPDFIFNVPVRIENAPSLNGHNFRVVCQVLVSGRAYRSDTTGPAIPIGPTGYTGTQRVEVRLPPTVSRSEARNYTCFIDFYTVTNTAGASVLWQGDAEQYRVHTGQTVRYSQILANQPLPR